MSDTHISACRLCTLTCMYLNVLVLWFAVEDNGPTERIGISCFLSVGYTMDVMYFSWLHEPVEIDSAIQLPQFQLKDHVLYECSQNYTGGKLKRRRYINAICLYHITVIYLLWTLQSRYFRLVVCLVGSMLQLLQTRAINSVPWCVCSINRSITLKSYSEASVIQAKRMKVVLGTSGIDDVRGVVHCQCS